MNEDRKVYTETGIIEIPMIDKLKRLSDEMGFPYREVWVMSLFVREEMLEEALECLVMLETPAEEYLRSVCTAPKSVIHILLNSEAVYI